MDFEAIQTRNELTRWPCWPQLGVDHEEHVREASAKVRPVGVMESRRLGIVHVHALGTVQLDHELARYVRQANGQQQLIVAVVARTVAKVAILVLLNHLRDPSIGEDEASMDQTVQHFRCLLHEISLQ